MHQEVLRASQAQTDAVDGGSIQTGQALCPVLAPPPPEHLNHLQQRAYGRSDGQLSPAAGEVEQLGGVDVATEGPHSQAAEDEEFDSELATWLFGKLQRLQPGAELTADSVRVLGRLLDQITERVLEEAQRASAGGPQNLAATAEAAEALSDCTRVAAPAASGHMQHQQEQRSTATAVRLQALTSLDIHKVSCL